MLRLSQFCIRLNRLQIKFVKTSEGNIELISAWIRPLTVLQEEGIHKADVIDSRITCIHFHHALDAKRHIVLSQVSSTLQLQTGKNNVGCCLTNRVFRKRKGKGKERRRERKEEEKKRRKEKDRRPGERAPQIRAPERPAQEGSLGREHTRGHPKSEEPWKQLHTKTACAVPENERIPYERPRDRRKKESS